MKPETIVTRIGAGWRGLSVLVETLGALGIRLMRAVCAQSLRAFVVTAVLSAVLLVNAASTKRVGDNLQVALPLLAWGCAAANGHGPEFFTRYAVMFTGAHAVKRLSGDAPWNIRPSGRGEGFPSAHSATAALGATSLAMTCLRQNPLAQGTVILAAGATGASRIEAGAHTFWQVLFGWLWGIVCVTVARPLTPTRRWLSVQFGRLRDSAAMLGRFAMEKAARSGRLFETLGTSDQR